MEIKTCEQYVLRELEILQREKEKLIEEKEKLAEEVFNMSEELGIFREMFKCKLERTSSTEGLRFDYIWKGEKFYDFAVKYLEENNEQ